MKTFLVMVALAVMPAFSQPNPRQMRPDLMFSAAGYGETIVTHIADGGGWKTSITLVNLSLSKTANFTLKLYGDDGNPQNFNFEGMGAQSVITGTLPAGGSVVIKTSGAAFGQETQGWGLLDYNGTTNSVGGYAIFSNINGNEATVPFEWDLEQNPVLPFDNTNGFGMGVALVNGDLIPFAMTINATVIDENGNVIGTESFTMAPNAHTAFILTDRWPFTAGKRGAVFFDCSTPAGPNALGLAVLGLRFTPQGGFTSVAALQEWTQN